MQVTFRAESEKGQGSIAEGLKVKLTQSRINIGSRVKEEEFEANSRSRVKELAEVNPTQSRVRRRSKVRNRKRLQLTWSMARHYLKQGLGVNFDTPEQTYLYLTYECSIGLLIVLALNFIKVEMISYKKPILHGGGKVRAGLSNY